MWPENCVSNVSSVVFKFPRSRDIPMTYRRHLHRIHIWRRCGMQLPDGLSSRLVLCKDHRILAVYEIHALVSQPVRSPLQNHQIPMTFCEILTVEIWASPPWPLRPRCRAQEGRRRRDVSSPRPHCCCFRYCPREEPS